jgi:hypothetical protein
VPRKIFVAGEILTASDVNTNLMDQAVMTFADDAARTTALPSPIEGMVTYLADSDALNVWNGSAWIPAASGASLGSGSILQVVSTAKTDTFSTTSTTFVDVTGLNLSITPASSSSKIYLSLTVGALDASAATELVARALRDSTPVGVGNADGSRSQAGLYRVNSAANRPGVAVWSFLDSPATSSSITYKIQVQTGAGTAFLNRASTDGNNAATGRTISTLTAVEVAG